MQSATACRMYPQWTAANYDNAKGRLGENVSFPLEGFDKQESAMMTACLKQMLFCENYLFRLESILKINE